MVENTKRTQLIDEIINMIKAEYNNNNNIEMHNKIKILK
jgi:hypothetical protein